MYDPQILCDCPNMNLIFILFAFFSTLEPFLISPNEKYENTIYGYFFVSKKRDETAISRYQCNSMKFC